MADSLSLSSSSRTDPPPNTPRSADAQPGKLPGGSDDQCATCQLDDRKPIHKKIKGYDTEVLVYVESSHAFGALFFVRLLFHANASDEDERCWNRLSTFANDLVQSGGSTKNESAQKELLSRLTESAKNERAFNRLLHRLHESAKDGAASNWLLYRLCEPSPEEKESSKMWSDFHQSSMGDDSKYALLSCLVKSVPQPANDTQSCKKCKKYHTWAKNFTTKNNLSADAFVLICISICQPMLYGFFLWAICDTFMEAERFFCQPGTEPSVVGNCFYFTLLAVYLLQTMLDLKGTVDLYLLISNRPMCDPKDGKRAETCLALGIYLTALLRQYGNWIYADQVLHIMGWHLLMAISIWAMYNEGDVPSMILNAAAAMYLEQLEEMFKARIFGSPGMRDSVRLELTTLREKGFCDCGETIGADSHDPLAFIKTYQFFVLLLHCLFFLALVIWIIFLAVMTASGCKPMNGKYHVF